tara:strand:+ start:35873 stop:36604 length:732 start_codon:yes stop_codon:yes gene_type:complete
MKTYNILNLNKETKDILNKLDFDKEEEFYNNFKLEDNHTRLSRFKSEISNSLFSVFFNNDDFYCIRNKSELIFSHKKNPLKTISLFESRQEKEPWSVHFKQTVYFNKLKQYETLKNAIINYFNQFLNIENSKPMINVFKPEKNMSYEDCKYFFYAEAFCHFYEKDSKLFNKDFLIVKTFLFHEFNVKISYSDFEFINSINCSFFKSFDFKDYQEFLRNKNLFHFENDKLTECSKNILLLNLKK